MRLARVFAAPFFQYTLPCCWPEPDTAAICEKSTLPLSLPSTVSSASIHRSVGEVTVPSSCLCTPPDVPYDGKSASKLTSASPTTLRELSMTTAFSDCVLLSRPRNSGPVLMWRFALLRWRKLWRKTLARSIESAQARRQQPPDNQQPRGDNLQPHHATQRSVSRRSGRSPAVVLPPRRSCSKSQIYSNVDLLTPKISKIMEDAPYFLAWIWKQHTHMENSLEKLDRENPHRRMMSSLGGGY